MTREKSSKLMFKPYYLVNEKTGEKITVHPPRVPGINAEKTDKKKTDKGEWIRRFDIVDTHGVKQFEGQTHIVMNHMPKMIPTIVINGEKWIVRPIGKEPASAKKIEAPAPIQAEAKASETKAPEAKSMLEKAQDDIRKNATVKNHGELKKSLSK